LDPIDIFNRIPVNTTIQDLSSFLERALRRSLHAQQELMLLKAIAVANFQVVDEQLYDRQRQFGGVVINRPIGHDEGAEPEPAVVKLGDKLEKREIDADGDDVIKLK